ncbi:MAG: hypothetical protein V3S69_00965 [Dehalococcoidales bacterium]
MQFDLFVPRDAYKDVVISEEPYVKIMGDIGWSYEHRCYAAVAQVNTSICVISLRIKELYDD